jgi:hypothetical protein
MADIQVTDNLGASAPKVKIDLSQPSSLLQYAKTELLHLLVAPEFIQRAPQRLTEAAPNPISFDLKLKHEFELGKDTPAIKLTPALAAWLRANTTKDSNLFENDQFAIPSLVPADTGYVTVGLKGALDLGVSGASGNLSFGVATHETLALEYWRAFPLGGEEEVTLGGATGEALSHFVIPASVADLERLRAHDVCAVAGTGSLEVSAGISVTAAPNPLASVDLPLQAGTLQVKTGAMAGVSASFGISGAYQIRARGTAAGVIELGVYKQKGQTLKTDFSASAGVTVKAAGTDLLKSLLDAISVNPNDDATKKLFEEGGLTQDEIETLTGAIKESLDHNVQVSLDLALSAITDDRAAFQYEIHPALLTADARARVEQALHGNLSGLTELEKGEDGADLAPGIKLLSSVLTSVHKRGTTLHLNLFGLVNGVSVSELLRKSVVVKDPASGALTITDSVSGTRINALVEDLRREALRKAVFESLLITATYRVSNAVSMTGVSSHNAHFVVHRGAGNAVLAEYLRWLVAMNLATKDEAAGYAAQVAGKGDMTCLLRTEFDDQACASLFFDPSGKPWDRPHYLEIGRQAMRAVIDRDANDPNRFRYDLLDLHWADAVDTGPNDNLAKLVGLHVTDSTGRAITGLLSGDVYTIVWWADTMVEAGKQVLAMREYLKTARPGDPEFDARRKALQKKMADLVSKSKARFEDPWGLISLFWAAGSSGASAKLVAPGLVLQKPDQPAVRQAGA